MISQLRYGLCEIPGTQMGRSRLIFMARQRRKTALTASQMRQAQSNLLGQIADRISDILMNIKILKRKNNITSVILLRILFRDIQETINVHIFSAIK